MKTLFLTFALIVFSVSITAQDYKKDLNSSLKNEPSVAQFNPLSDFTIDVITKEKFKYRDFVSKSRQSKDTYQIGQKVYSRIQLVELLRKNAKKSVDNVEFHKLLMQENPQFSSYFSNEEMVALYEKFRKGTIHKYVNDLASEW